MRRLIAGLALAAILAVAPAADAAVNVRLKRSGKVLRYTVTFTKAIWLYRVSLATADPTSSEIYQYHVVRFTHPKIKGMTCDKGSQSVTCYAPGSKPFGPTPVRGKPIPAGTVLRGTLTFNKAIGRKKVVGVSGDTPTGAGGSAGFANKKLA
jgi:hypothetical protein